MNRIAFPLVCVLMATSTASSAQFAAQRLAATRTLTCTFTTLAIGTWINGEAQAQVKPAKLSIKFEEIDSDEGTARIASDVGKYDIIVRLTEDTLHFVQMFRSGPLYSTTVFSKENAQGKFKAVHSRHEYTDVILPGFTSRPEQYYGECQAGS